MGLAAGRRLMRRLLSKGGLYESVFRPRPLLTPEQAVVFNGAQRDFAQWLHDELMMCAPVSFGQMNDEARERVLKERLALVETGKTTEETDGE